MRPPLKIYISLKPCSCNFSPALGEFWPSAQVNIIGLSELISLDLLSISLFGIFLAPVMWPTSNSSDSLTSITWAPALIRVVASWTVILWPPLFAKALTYKKIKIFSSDYLKTNKKSKNLLDEINENKINILVGTQMISKGFNLVTVGSDQRFMSGGAKSAVEKIKKIKKGSISKGY